VKRLAGLKLLPERNYTIR